MAQTTFVLNAGASKDFRQCPPWFTYVYGEVEGFDIREQAASMHALSKLFLTVQGP
jgi:hypothetical protein